MAQPYSYGGFPAYSLLKPRETVGEWEKVGVGGGEEEYGRTREAHCEGEEAQDRPQTIPKRSALFLFFACRDELEEKEKKKSKPERNKQTSALKPRTTRWRAHCVFGLGNDAGAQRLRPLPERTHSPPPLVQGSVEGFILRLGTKSAPKSRGRGVRWPRSGAAEGTWPRWQGATKGLSREQ